MRELPNILSEQVRSRLTELTSMMFKTPIEKVTKEQMLVAIQMEMKTSITEFTISCSSTRPSEVKYATNNYHISAKLDVAGTYQIIMNTLDNEPLETLLDRYFQLRQGLFSLLSIKYDNMEDYLRKLLYSAEQKDNCPKVGRFNNE
jgi:hypothetical protein